MVNDGGPAFPTLGDAFMQTPDGSWSPKSHYGMQGELGMTLRDYFAAHAPVAPDSFQCKKPPQPARPKTVDKAFQNDRLRRLASDYRRDPCFELSEMGETLKEREGLRQFQLAQDSYASACELWRKAFETYRQIEWRWFYADAMLAARYLEKGAA